MDEKSRNAIAISAERRAFLRESEKNGAGFVTKTPVLCTVYLWSFVVVAVVT